MLKTVLDREIHSMNMKDMDSLLLESAIHLAIGEVNMKHFFSHDPDDYEAMDGKVPYISETQVAKAIRHAAYLHRRQTRANRAGMPRTHYIEHPLRNALRALRYGVTDQDMIVAAILHDTLEDCLGGLLKLAGIPHEFGRSDEKGRELALTYITSTFGPRVSLFVLMLSNPLPDGIKRSRQQKRELYVEHVKRAIVVPEVAILKFCDFVDNGVGLYHNDLPEYQEMVAHLARKYLPLVEVFDERLPQKDVMSLVPLEGFRGMLQHVVDGEVHLSRLVAKAESSRS